MPYAKIQTPTCAMDFHYYISTSSNPDATSIDKNIPTILFLHSAYFGSVSYHNQLQDANVRKFNCFIFDARCHGASVGHVQKNWGPVQAAEDAMLLLDSFGIDKVHVFGVQMGSLTALHIAMLYPERCLSAYLLSPLSVREPEDILQGKHEIADCWEQGFNDPVARGDAVFGALQLAFSHEFGTLAQAMCGVDLPHALQRNAPERRGDFRIITLDFFTVDRDANYSKDGFARIQCPVKLTFCSGDIAYTLEQAQELYGLLQSAGVDVSFDQVDGCHYANVTNPEDVNKSLVEFIEEVDPSTADLPVPKEVTSPYEAQLRACGYEDEPEFVDSNHVVV